MIFCFEKVSSVNVRSAALADAFYGADGSQDRKESRGVGAFRETHEIAGCEILGKFFGEKYKIILGYGSVDLVVKLFGKALKTDRSLVPTALFAVGSAVFLHREKDKTDGKIRTR